MMSTLASTSQAWLGDRDFSKLFYGLAAVAVGQLVIFGCSSAKHKYLPQQKQGDYGKVAIHKHGIMATLLRPAELLAGLRYKLKGKAKVGLLIEGKPESACEEDVLFCEQMLVAVSRSFSAVIRKLPLPLRLPVAVFYLVLRALDTVEDEMDMSRFERYRGSAATDRDAKLALLASFHEKLSTSSWTLQGIGEADERRLLEEFDKVLRVFQSLPSGHQKIIAEITRKMSTGMAEFVPRDMTAGTNDTADYNLYCHYVAGLVGQGLTEQFVASGLELAELGNEKGMDLANSMGLFLQKTNIIRDYLEDLVDGRSFWPKDVYSKYVPELKDARAGGDQALACLNHMVTDALECGRDALVYMEQLRDPGVFSFCAVPQVMAIATLAELYDNPNVFTGVVKIRSGQAALILQQTGDIDAVRGWFTKCASQIIVKIKHTDPSAVRTKNAAMVLSGST